MIAFSGKTVYNNHPMARHDSIGIYRISQKNNIFCKKSVDKINEIAILPPPPPRFLKIHDTSAVSHTENKWSIHFRYAFGLFSVHSPCIAAQHSAYEHRDEYTDEFNGAVDASGKTGMLRPP